MDWFKDAPVVRDLFSRSPDAEFIFDDDVECGWTALEWRECEVPVSAFGIEAQTLNEHLAALLPAATMADELRRIQSIEQWMVELGGVCHALDRSPLLITLRNGRIDIQDGYHRLGMAFFGYGVKTVKSLCALHPTSPMVNNAPPSGVSLSL